MKRTVGVLLGLILIFGVVGIAASQDQAKSQGMHSPPKVLVINREFLKPGRGGMMHEKSEGAFVQAMSKANSSSYYIAMESMSGKSRVLFLEGFDSLAAWEKDNQAIAKNASLSSALDQAAVNDGNLLDAYDQSVFLFDDELSLRAPVDIPHMRYMEIQVFRVKPGHSEEWNAAVKMVKGAYEKALPDAHWATFRLLYGGAVGTYAVFTPLKSIAEVDQMIGDNKKFAMAMGEDGMKKLSELISASVESREMNLFSFSPKMSYAPPEWVKADPEFWKPAMKMTSTSGKKPAGAKPTP